MSGDLFLPKQFGEIGALEFQRFSGSRLVPAVLLEGSHQYVLAVGLHHFMIGMQRRVQS